LILLHVVFTSFSPVRKRIDANGNSPEKVFSLEGKHLKEASAGYGFRGSDERLGGKPRPITDVQ